MWRGARARGAVGGTVSPSYCSPSFTEVGRHKSWQLRATPAYMPPPPPPAGAMATLPSCRAPWHSRHHRRPVVPAAFCSRRCPLRPLTRACFSCPCDRYAAPLQDWPQPAQTSWAPALAMAEGPSYKLRAALIFPSYLRRQPQGGLHVLLLGTNVVRGNRAMMSRASQAR